LRNSSAFNRFIGTVVGSQSCQRLPNAFVFQGRLHSQASQPIPMTTILRKL
jgi:hypothetical protein